MLKTTDFSQTWLFRMLFFFLCCVLGWMWEVFYYWISHHMQVNLMTAAALLRGFLHGPWAPVYGVGCIGMLLIHDHFPGKPVCFFLTGTAVCGVIEYMTSWLLEIIFHARWWDYSGQFMNLGGRVCLGALLFFGLAGCIIIFLLEPVFRKQVSRISIKKQQAACFLLSLLFFADTCYSYAFPNFRTGVWVLQGGTL